MSTEKESVPESVPEIHPMVKQLNTMSELLETLSKTSKSLTIEMKALTKDVNKMRLSTNRQKKPKRVQDPDVPRKLGALEKPVPITEELCEFLGLQKDELYSRQSITQGINKYVKDHDLQNPENRRFILLESEHGLKLKTLLRDPDQPLTFFNIQRYLKVHYPKVEETSVVVPNTVPNAVPNAVPEVVADDAVVEETPVVVEPKKKVVRKVVRRSTAEVTA